MILTHIKRFSYVGCVMRSHQENIRWGCCLNIVFSHIPKKIEHCSDQNRFYSYCLPIKLYLKHGTTQTNMFQAYLIGGI
jgi:hypothetical protein